MSKTPSGIQTMPGLGAAVEEGGNSHCNLAGSDCLAGASSLLDQKTTAPKTKMTEQIQWVKFSGATWLGNGFFYSRYDEPAKGKDFSNQNEFMKIYYHVLGSNQSEDVLIYEDKKHPLRYFNVFQKTNAFYTFLFLRELLAMKYG